MLGLWPYPLYPPAVRTLDDHTPISGRGPRLGYSRANGWINPALTVCLCRDTVESSICSSYRRHFSLVEVLKFINASDHIMHA